MRSSAPTTTTSVGMFIAALASPAEASPWWLSPFDRAAWQLDAFHEADRPYSTDVKPRDIAGDVALSCEHVEGRPCGHGVGTFEELDSAAGYGSDALAFVRLRAHAGTGAYDNGLDVDGVFVRARNGAFAVEAGRDVLAFGPAAHTTVGWGDNAPPLDHVHVAFATARGSLTYVVGRLRDPQAFSGNLVTIARGTLVLGDVTLGGMQLLQLEGDGAPHLGVVDFISEHVTRGNASAGPDDTSNRRVGLDVDWRIAGFDGARIYYQLMFEDWRRQFADALRYDADHVVGMAFSHGLVVEWQKTGFRSMEHTPRITGFTN